MAANPQQVARAFVTFYGPVMGCWKAQGMAARAPAHSDRAVFFDQVSREIERGLFVTP